MDGAGEWRGRHVRQYCHILPKGGENRFGSIGCFLCPCGDLPTTFAGEVFSTHWAPGRVIKPGGERRAHADQAMHPTFPNAAELLRHLPVGVLVVRDGHIERATGLAEPLVGRSLSRLDGALLADVAPPEAVEVVGRILDGASSCTAAGVSWDRSTSKLSITGSAGPEAGQVVLVIAPFTNPDAHPRGESFRGRLAWLAGLAAGLAHEIRNPLGGIRGAAQLLRRNLHSLSLLEPMNPGVPSLDSTATEECDELTDLIIQEADRIGDRVSRLMEIARPVPLRRAVVSVNVLVHEGVALLRADPSQRRVDFQLDLDPSLPGIDGDPVRLAEAVGNLLRNAAEAADQTVLVRTRLYPEGRFLEAGLDRGLAIRLDVQDDGTGISETAEADLFVPFATTKLEGSGLGLFVTRLAIEDHAGRIDVLARPQPDEALGSTGACFSLILFESLPTPPASLEVDPGRVRRRPLPSPSLESLL